MAGRRLKSIFKRVRGVVFLFLVACSLPAANYVDTSDSPANRPLILRSYVTNADFLLIGVEGYPSNDRLTFYRLVPPPGFAGREVMSNEILPKGTGIQVLGARRCTNCGPSDDQLRIVLLERRLEQPVYLSKRYIRTLLTHLNRDGDN